MGKIALPPAVENALYWAFRAVTAAATLSSVEAMRSVARRTGRLYALSPFNGKRLLRAQDNLRVAFPDWDDAQTRSTAIQSYEHLFMLGLETMYAPRLLNEEGWTTHLGMVQISEAVVELWSGLRVVLSTRHCGNFDLVRYTLALLGFPMHALYRPMDLRPLDEWMRQTRQRRGLVLVDKFGALKRLPEIMRAGAPVGFVADQSGGDRGIFVPFFNRVCSTYKSIGLLAMQFDAAVICGCARRLAPGEHVSTGLGGYSLPGDEAAGMRYDVDLVDLIRPEDWKAQPDPLFYLTARYRRAIETMIRRSPEQYFWMHRIWRARPRHERLGKPFPKALREKIAQLPWITDSDMARILEHSERDAATLKATGMDRLP